MIKQLTDAIQKNRTFVSFAAGQFDDLEIDIKALTWDNATNTVYFFCDADDDSALSFTKIFAEAHKHPTATMAIICEELEAIIDVTDFRIVRGNPSFGEPNYVVLM